LSTTRTRRIGAAAGAAAVLAAGVALASPSAAQIPDADLLGLRRDNQLVRFDPATPGTTTITPVTGIGADTLIGIDTRPNGNVLYGYALDGSIYTIDPVSGAATEVASASPALGGADAGVDFNPVPDRLRVEGGDGDQNHRINVDVAAGGVTQDLPLNYAGADQGTNPVVVGAAYTNSVAPSPRDAATQGGTQLFVIDSGIDALALQNPPNDGILTRVGTGLGVDTSSAVGFEIYSTAVGTNTAFASLDVGGVNGLYTIDLATGAATLVGAIANGGGDIVSLTTTGSIPVQGTTTTTVAVGGSTATTAPAGVTPTTARVLARTGDEEGKGALVGGLLLAAGAAAVIAGGRLRTRGTA
jgi:hypothetical protein